MADLGPPRPWSIVVSAEHAGRGVPDEYRDRLEGYASLLDSHRGWDPGSLDLAERLASALDAPLQAATVTRLVVDTNRSRLNRNVFSEVTRGLPRAERERLLERYHRPHRDAVRVRVTKAVETGHRVLHLGIHTFTPVLHGVVRKPDVGLLYDPARPSERRLAAVWQHALRRRDPTLIVRRNDPYRGNADGLTTTLRTLHPDAEYLGIEVEVNQKHLDEEGRVPALIFDALLSTLPSSLGKGAKPAVAPHRS